MGNCSQALEFPDRRLAALRARVAEIHGRARRLFEGSATGVQVAAAISEPIDVFLVDLFVETLSTLGEQQRSVVERNSAVIAVGGTGRGEAAPHSDADLLFLYRGAAGHLFSNCVSQAVRDYWDAGIQLGHSVQTLGESISLARQEPEVATAVVEARLLWGDQTLFAQFKRKFSRRVVCSRLPAFVDDCVAAREKERIQHGSTVHQLEPDIKRSLGGLRDVHLIRWIGFAHYGTAEIDALRLLGALSKKDARLLVAAMEYLMRIRTDLHFEAGKTQDILTREEQLRISEQRRIEAPVGQRPVECFMQTYFRHSTAITDIAQRFVARHRPDSLGSRFVQYVTTRRANGIFKVGRDRIDVLRRHQDFVCGDLEQILKLYHSALIHGVPPSPELTEQLTQSIPTFERSLSGKCVRLFLDILGGQSGHLGTTLRSMYNTGLLELIIPDLAHARCLLQFNLYHSYTVDEHTLRSIEVAEQYEQDHGPLGTAYRAIHHKEILHLALLLHDLGKGFDEEHREVGKRIAERIAERLELPDHLRNTLVFLVHQHLKMSHLAFRRDISNTEVLMEFSREVGSPKTLQMLYVLTAADLTAVGPGRWTEWKAELLAELYNRVMLILSGKPYQFHEERLQQIKDHVYVSIVERESPSGDAGMTVGLVRRQANEISIPDGAAAGTVSELGDTELQDWISEQLDAFSPHYLSATPPERIAADLDRIRQLHRGKIVVEGRFNHETGTVDYRVIAHEDDTEGCFHRTTGVLTAKRLKILAAQISTSRDGVMVDNYRVIDNDYPDEVPPKRIEEVAGSIRSALQGSADVHQLFQQHRRFQTRGHRAPVSDLPMRVAIDNHSSDFCTIIDVFAHDRPGLLYTLTRTIYETGLSVVLAKIATHLDQVVDVFYVTDFQGKKLEKGDRLRSLQRELEAKIEHFERQGHLQFAP